MPHSFIFNLGLPRLPNGMLLQFYSIGVKCPWASYFTGVNLWIKEYILIIFFVPSCLRGKGPAERPLEAEMNTSNISKVIEDFSHLPPEDKEYVAEIIKKQVIEEKRNRLAERAREARANFERGSAKMGTLKDLMEDLDSY